MTGAYFKPSGTAIAGNLTGTELVTVDNGGPLPTTATTQQIANLLGSSGVITTLSTVGAGTITAAGIIGRITKRAGSQSNTAFTDTTASGALLDAGLTAPVTNQSWIWTYQNTTDATGTLTGGSGVTVSGITAVPAHCSAMFVVTRTGSATYTIVGFLITAPSSVSGTFTANGTSAVTIADTNVTASSTIVITLKTVGGTVGAVPHVDTITAGTGFTIKGTASDTSVYNYLIIN